MLILLTFFFPFIYMLLSLTVLLSMVLPWKYKVFLHVSTPRQTRRKPTSSVHCSIQPEGGENAATRNLRIGHVSTCTVHVQ
jgi:hypothetical protein